MKANRARSRDRSGFTLIELLVVIGIIGILAAIVSAAVMKFLSKGPQLVTTNELQNALPASLENFKVQYKFYPPSQIRLCKLLSQYQSGGNALLNADSVAYLSQITPRITDSAGPWSGAGIDWSGGVVPNFSDTTLEGDQCLVFFLGGIPTVSGNVPGCTGFSTNARDPTAAGGDKQKFYDFPSNRLRNMHGNGFFSFVDPYGKQPYLYFSSYKKENNYNRYGATDCPSANVWPYAMAPGRFHQPTRFQIISAGKDAQFGPGTNLSGGGPFYWSPSSAGQYNGAGADDQANFYSMLLGNAS